MFKSIICVLLASVALSSAFSIREKIGSEVKANECIVCKVVAEMVTYPLRQNATDEEIVLELEKVCKIFPGNLRNQCLAFINEYGIYVIDMVMQDATPDIICSKLGFCSSAEGPKEPALKDVGCDVCLKVAQFIDDKLKENKTDEIILKDLESMCYKLAPKISEQCVTLLNNYGAILIQFVANKLQPQLLCETLDICKKSTREPRTESNNIASMLSKVKLILQPLSSSSLKSDVECTVCQMVAGFADNLLKQNKTEQEIIKDLESICSLFPASLGAQCNAFLNEYGPYVIQLIAKDLSPEVVCKALRLCTSNVEHEDPVVNKPTFSIKGETCALCKIVVKFIERGINMNKTEAVILSDMKKVCNLLPAGIKNECNNLVDEYGEYIINLIIKKISADQICAIIGCCVTAPEQKIQPMISKIENVACTICKFVTNVMKHELAQNKTEQEILSGLDRICNIVPIPFKGQCLSFINEYGIYAIQLLVNDLTQEDVCHVVVSCPTEPPTKRFRRSVLTSIEQSIKSEECVICKFVAGVIDHELSLNRTKQEILFELQRVCNLFPPSLKTTCNTMVQEYGIYLINLIISELTPDEVCGILGLCTSGKAQSENVSSLRKLFN